MTTLYLVIGWNVDTNAKKPYIVIAYSAGDAIREAEREAIASGFVPGAAHFGVCDIFRIDEAPLVERLF